MQVKFSKKSKKIEISSEKFPGIPYLRSLMLPFREKLWKWWRESIFSGLQRIFRNQFGIFNEIELLYRAFGCILLKHISNFYRRSHRSLDKVNDVRDVLSTRVRVLTREGLHARPASQIATMLSKREAKLTLVKKDDPSAVADCSSVLDMLIMAAAFNTELELLAEGPDAKIALEEVERYFNNKFDEEL